MRLLIDTDGVLCDFIGGVLDLVYEATGRRCQHGDIRRFDFASELGLHSSEKNMVTSTISHRPDWWLNLSPFPGAIAGFARLRLLGHDVKIVTSPWNSCPTWLYQREAWLKKHFDIDHKDVIACSAKHCVAGDVLVDDKTETLAKWQKHHDGLAIQWVTPHNQLDGWTGPATNDWDQLRRMVASWEADR